jgi:hypothetical protein
MRYIIDLGSFLCRNQPTNFSEEPLVFTAKLHGYVPFGYIKELLTVLLQSKTTAIDTLQLPEWAPMSKQYDTTISCCDGRRGLPDAYKIDAKTVFAMHKVA